MLPGLKFKNCPLMNAFLFSGDVIYHLCIKSSSSRSIIYTGKFLRALHPKVVEACMWQQCIAQNSLNSLICFAPTKTHVDMFGNHEIMKSEISYVVNIFRDGDF